ncbi:hypothetical protein LTR27_002714 [Elasticomyces elasticus]|nr:hypothetical protein LTR27_002714 [Elasticomyces elasticus]
MVNMFTKPTTLATLATLLTSVLALPPTPNSIRIGLNIHPSATAIIPGKDVTPPTPTAALTTYPYTGVYCGTTGCFTSTTTHTKQYVVQTISEYVIEYEGNCNPPDCTVGPQTTVATTVTMMYETDEAVPEMKDPFTRTAWAA